MKERTLWAIFRGETFEEGIAARQVPPEEDVLALIDCPAFFTRLQLPLPERRDGILERLVLEKVSGAASSVAVGHPASEAGQVGRRSRPEGGCYSRAPPHD